MWECPEFFALEGGHVLIYSTLGKVFWQSGVLDEATMKFKPSKTGLLDLGAYYAPKTQAGCAGPANPLGLDSRNGGPRPKCARPDGPE